MEARDCSMGFDFAGTYTRVEPHRLIEYAFGDRNARVEFSESPAGVGVRVIFDAESTHSTEQQQAGWQAILDNFRRHVEGAARINPFCWYELMTTDAPAALDYYRRVIGWNTKPAGMGPVPYTLLSVGEAAIGGVFELTPDMCSQGARPAWIGYMTKALSNTPESFLSMPEGIVSVASPDAGKGPAQELFYRENVPAQIEPEPPGDDGRAED